MKLSAGRTWKIAMIGVEVLILTAVCALILKRQTATPQRSEFVKFVRSKMPFSDQRAGSIIDLEDERSQRFYLVADPLLGYRAAANATLLSPPFFLYLTNDQGFSSTGQDVFHFDIPKPKGTFRVMIVGGSTVFGLCVVLPRQNLPAHLERELKSAGISGNVELINAGVPGYASSDELLYFLTNLTAYDPDLLIVYDGWNEITRPIGSDLSSAMFNNAHVANQRRLRETYTFRGFVQHGAQWAAATFYLPTAHPKVGVSDPAGGEFLDKALARYKSNLSSLIVLARQRHIRIAVCLQPILGGGAEKLTGEEIQKIPNLQQRKEFYRGARLLFSELATTFRQDQNVAVIDLSRALADETGLYYDTGHLKDPGNARIAEQLSSTLKRTLLKDVALRKGAAASVQIAR